MTRGESTQSKVHYKGKQEDFLVFVDDVDTYKKWQSDKSIPPAHFISTFNVFLTHRYVPISSPSLLPVPAANAQRSGHWCFNQIHMTAANSTFTYRQGAQGTFDSASKMELAAEFDTENTDEAILKILEQGSMQNMEVSQLIHYIKMHLP